MPASRMLATWTLLVAAAAFWDGLCTHSTYDLRGSTDDCVRWTSLDLSECAAAGEGCASPSTLKQASPRWLGSLAGMGGPLMTWLPLLLGAREPAHVRPVLLAALPWYLALIGPVRHTHRLLDSRWDPSGHVFVYGAQLVPLACIRLGLLHPATQAWLALWATTLTYLSITTASFFHTPSETAAGYFLVAALWAWYVHVTPGLAAGSALERRPLTPTAAAGGSSSPLWTVAGAAHLPRRVAAALAVWASSTAASWLTCGASEVGTLAGFLGYDALLWLLLVRLSAEAAAEPSAQPQAGALGRDGVASSSENVGGARLAAPAHSPAGSSLRSRNGTPPG